MHRIRPALVDELLASGQIDRMDVAWVHQHVRAADPGASVSVLQRETLELIHGLLRRGWLEVGQLCPTRGFTPWRLGAGAAVDRIRDEWEALGRVPDFHDPIALRLTERGTEALTQGDDSEAASAP